MSIQGKVNELNSIKHELKTLRVRGCFLRKRAKQIEQEISEYLNTKEQPGLKYQGTAIIKEDVQKRRIKKKDEARADALYILEKYNINSPGRVLDEILDSKKGSPIEHTKLKFKKINKNI